MKVANRPAWLQVGEALAKAPGDYVRATVRARKST
jgi:hypothetical protein